MTDIVATYNHHQLAEKLLENLMTLSGGSYSYAAGYLVSVLGQVAKHGIDELTAAVDYTNQRVENLHKETA